MEHIIVDDADLDVVVFNIQQRNNIIGHVAENLAIPLEPLQQQRRQPIRNRGYVENTIPLYTLDEFKRHFRMSRISVEVLILEIGNRLHPKREPQVHLEKKVLFTIWMLGKPETFLACSDRFGLAPSTGHYILTEIVSVMPDVITWPTIQQCRSNATIFEDISRGIPNVIGAIDDTHILIKQLVGNAVDYYNRYQSHSVIVQGVCDSNKRFMNISVGHPGRMHDARIFRRSLLYQSMINDNNPLIGPEYHLIGDSAYPLTPFRDTGHLTNQQTIYNTRFSSIRSVNERAFGLLKGKWRRLKYLDMGDMVLLNKIITACCVLHNFCINQDGDEDFEDVANENNDDFPAININEQRRHLLGEKKQNQIMNALV